MAGLSITDLPDSILLRIFQLLPMSDLRLGVGQACWQWNSLSYDPSLCRVLDMCERYDWTTDDMLSQALKKVQQHVHTIDLACCLLIKGTALLREDIYCPNLVEINISDTNMEDDTVIAIAKRYPRLQRVVAKCCNEFYEFISLVNILVDLRELHVAIEDLYSTDAFCQALSQRTSINKLEISESLGLRDDHVSLLASKMNLVELLVPGCHIGDEALQAACPSLGLLQILDISETAVTDKGLKLVAESCPELKSLTTSLCRSVTDVGLADIAQQCQKLRKLYVNTSEENVANLTDVGLNDIAVNCPTLQVLEICSCPQVTEKGIECLALNCLDLRVLDISQCLAVTDTALHALAKGSTRLSVLKAAGCVQLTANGINDLLKSCPGIQRLDIDNCHHVKGFCHLQDLPRKTRPRNTDPNHLITCESEKHAPLVSHKEGVESAKAQDPDKDTDESNKENHQELWLSPTTGKFITRATPVDGTNQPTGAAGGQSCPVVSGGDATGTVRQLERLTLTPGIAGIIHTQLSYLNLPFCSKIANDSVKNIANHCPCLLQVSFRGCYLITDHGIIYLTEKCRRLNILDVSGGSAFGPSRLTDGTVFALAKNSSALEGFYADKVYRLTLPSIRELLQKCRRLDRFSVSCAKNIELPELIQMVQSERSWCEIATYHAKLALEKGQRFNEDAGVHFRPIRS